MTDILYFGRLADEIGTGSETLDIPANVADSAALRSWLDERHGGNGALLETSVRLAFDSEIVREPAPLSAANEIAFLPAVGGG